MDELFFNLFGQPLGTDTGTQVSLYAVSTLLTCFALLLLARRNDLGWWAQLLAVFAGPLAIALQYDYSMLLLAVPAMGAAAFGLWKFSKSPNAGRFGRALPVRGFTVKSLIWGAVLTIVFTALKLGPMLTTGFAFSQEAVNIWILAALEAIVLAALIGIANGLRWAWLAITVSAVAYVAILFTNAPALVTLGLLVFQFLASLYGWFSWRQSPADVEPAEAASAEYPPSPYNA